MPHINPFGFLNQNNGLLYSKGPALTTTQIAIEEDADDIGLRWQAIIDEIKDEYISETQRFPWIVGFSGGKDSTVLVHAVFEALLAIPPSRRSRQVYIVSNDTLVESPLVMSHLNDVTSRIDAAADSLGLPISVARTSPDLVPGIRAE